MDQDKIEVGKWFMWGIVLLVVLAVVGWGLSAIGLFGSTVVERKVFENSIQYSEARKSEIATFEAQLAEIDRKLSNPEINPDTRHNLEAQASAIRIQLDAAKRR